MRVTCGCAQLCCMRVLRRVPGGLGARGVQGAADRVAGPGPGLVVHGAQASAGQAHRHVQGELRGWHQCWGSEAAGGTQTVLVGGWTVAHLEHAHGAQARHGLSRADSSGQGCGGLWAALEALRRGISHVRCQGCCPARRMHQSSLVPLFPSCVGTGPGGRGVVGQHPHAPLHVQRPAVLVGMAVHVCAVWQRREAPGRDGNAGPRRGAQRHPGEGRLTGLSRSGCHAGGHRCSGATPLRSFGHQGSCATACSLAVAPLAVALLCHHSPPAATLWPLRKPHWTVCPLAVARHAFAQTVAFKLTEPDGRVRKMELLAGFLGCTVDAAEGSIAPCIGWAVAEDAAQAEARVWRVATCGGAKRPGGRAAPGISAVARRLT